MLAEIARIALLCNDAGLEKATASGRCGATPPRGPCWHWDGRRGLPRGAPAEFPRVAEIPFSSDVKRMSTFHQEPDGFLHVRQGGAGTPAAPGRKMLTAQGERPMQDGRPPTVHEQAGQMAQEALGSWAWLTAVSRKVPRSGIAARPRRIWFGWGWWA